MENRPELTLRPATDADLPALRALIDASVRGLGPGYYTPEQIESGLRYVFGPDTALIADGTYFVIADDGGDTALAASGGWSRRRTLYGGDQKKGDEPDPLLDPAQEAARIRAFFVHPDYARRGLARRLFARCAADAAAAGFTSLELMATLPGIPLYTALGFREVAPLTETLPDGVALPMVRMTRAL